ncbi:MULTISPECIES: hypothetical protein [unclassified Sphingomonas]|uniref:hypothetical protein n=1 Tax=unclassified Sphingomonas TaxID=196159 RepID=UPI0027865E3C|nr:hypothetical protein [Sphingomonas sp. SORGH_AS_0879]MDQ1231311.1 hypothetical protein [Sphingomonas sp. SORGH_AS_0879]
MRDSEMYLQRAADCRHQADESDLANVRDRCLRAEAAWSAMAQRSLRTEAARDARAVVGAASHAV